MDAGHREPKSLISNTPGPATATKRPFGRVFDSHLDNRDSLTSISFPGLHREGRIASKQLQQRSVTDITNFMDLVEASTRYPVREACLGGVPG